MASREEVTKWQAAHESLADILATVSASMQINEYAVTDIPLVASAAPGDGVTFFIAERDTIFLWEFCAISIVPGDEFDGDYTLDIYVDGEQGTAALGGANPGDVNATADVSVSQTAGLWQYAAMFGPVSGSPVPPRIVNTRYFLPEGAELKAVMESGSTPPTMGRVSLLTVTMGG